MLVFGLYFTLGDGDVMSRRLSDWLPFAPADNDRPLSDTRDLVIASVGAGVAVAAADGLLGGIAFAVAGVCVVPIMLRRQSRRQLDEPHLIAGTT